MSDFLAKKCINFQTVGGEGGSSFSSYKEDGSLVSRMEVWTDENRMRGIKVYFSNTKEGYSFKDKGFMYGKEVGTKFEYNFAPGETITNFSIYNTKFEGKFYVCSFKFTTSLGKMFYPKSFNSVYKEYPMEFGFGAFVGIGGRFSEAIDSLGFYFIKEAKKFKLSNVVYDKTKFSAPVVKKIVNMPFTNNSETNQSYDYKYSYSPYHEKIWSISSGFRKNYSLTINAEVPVVEAFADANKASASWKFTQETINNFSYSYAQQVSRNYPVFVAPHTQVNLDMTYYTGDCEFPYYGYVTLTFDNNETFSFYATGTFKGGNSSQVVSTMTSTPVSASGKPYGQSEVNVEFVNYEKMAA